MCIYIRIFITDVDSTLEYNRCGYCNNKEFNLLKSLRFYDAANVEDFVPKAERTQWYLR